MDALSNLFGLLTGTWTKQSTTGKALLSCALLLIMFCVCCLPLLILSLIPVKS